MTYLGHEVPTEPDYAWNESLVFSTGYKIACRDAHTSDHRKSKKDNVGGSTFALALCPNIHIAVAGAHHAQEHPRGELSVMADTVGDEKLMTPPKYGNRHATLCPLTLCIKFPLYCKKFCAKVRGSIWSPMPREKLHASGGKYNVYYSSY
jgi:hypothetical protein